MVKEMAFLRSSVHVRVGAIGACFLVAYAILKRVRRKSLRFGNSDYVHWSSQSKESRQRSYREDDISEVIRTASSAGWFGIDTSNPVAIFHDMDCQKETFQALIDSYPAHFFHTFAVKSNPLPFVLRTAVEMGMGLEAASFGEVANCIRQVSTTVPNVRRLVPNQLNPTFQGCPPERIVFDSPAKTRREIAVRSVPPP